ncbi:MAG: pyrroline-5-carboxylate reductase [Hyphomicrobiales bacterium]
MTLISSDRPVVLVGAGKMGGAMLSGWLNKGTPGNHFSVVDPYPCDEMQAMCRAKDVACLSSVPDDLTPSVVIVAVKPQMMQDVLPSLTPLAKADPVFVSVAAGISSASFEKVFGGTAAVVRAMPNTPAQVGRGITIGYATAHVNEAQKEAVADLLAVSGAFDWVEAEALIDAVTAVSGSGPAYVFYMVEAMAAAGVKAGLAPDLAMKLARATVEGAGELLYQSDLDAATLRQNVTSPGGTTAAALNVLMAEGDGLGPLMTKAIGAAKKRAEELGEE